MTTAPLVHGQQMQAKESQFRATVTDHLGADPNEMPLLTETFSSWQKVDLQRAIEAYLSKPGRESRIVGVNASSSAEGGGGVVIFGMTPNLAGLLSKRGTRFGGVEYEQLPSGSEEKMVCIRTGLILVSGPGGPLAIWIREQGRRPYSIKFVDVLAGTVEDAQAFFKELRQLMKERNCFRGNYVKLSADAAGHIEVDFLKRPEVKRADVILPPGVLEGVEGHAIGIEKAAKRLVASGRHLKRGLLLYGPPGTGKTHTISYLASQLPEATLFVMTGSGMAWLNFIKRILPDVAPAIVVLDDVDLVAEDRDLPGMAPRSLLFSLLDAMDGINEDSDVLFVCTSNRAETLEKAIAARPGRIDHAVELALPDKECRRRLIDLYAAGLDLQLAEPEIVIEHTEGVTASFIKEMLRRAYLVARKAGTTTVTDEHVHLALDQLLDPNNPLTPALLGMDEKAYMERVKVRGVGQQWCGI